MSQDQRHSQQDGVHLVPSRGYTTRSARCPIRSAVLFVVFAGCNDSALTQFTEPPVVAIETPVSGSVMDEGVPINMRGRVVDKAFRDALSQIAVTWAVDGARVCEAAVFGDDGVTQCDNIFPAGPATITLTATDPDGQTAVSVAEVEFIRNTAPTAQILSPEYGLDYYSNALTLFEGKASDGLGEDLPEELVVTWTSSLDGVLPLPPTPASDGSVSGSYELSAGEHQITLTVADTTGRTGTDTTTIQVLTGSRPSLTLLTPASGDVVNDGESILFSALVDDLEDDPATLELEWSSSIDGIFSYEGASTAGDVAFTYRGLLPGTHTIKVTATDSDGLTASDSATLYVNTLPTAPIVDISPDPTGSADDLQADIVEPSFDAEGDSITYTYAWYLNGVATGYTYNPLPAGYTNRDETWTVYVTPSDGFGNGPAGSASTRIGNGLPTLASCTITPATAYTNDELTATPGGYSDPDGDPESTLYQWYRNGSPISGATFATLSGITYFDRGDDITVDCTAFDGYGSGTTVTSGTRTIQDSPPTAPTVDVTPDEPEDDEYLACAAVVASTDDDGDSINYTYAWTRDGVGTGLTGTTVDPSYTSNGETWTCTVTPDDGTVSGPTGSDSVLVEDYTAPDAPVLTGLDPYRNEDSATIYGTTEALSTVTLYIVNDSGITTDTTTANAAGSFTFSVTLARGQTYSFYATSADARGNTSDPSNVVSTEACEPWDEYEDGYGYGDTCPAPVVDWGTLADDGTTSLSIVGNILEGSDEDWYLVETADGATPGINYYRFHVELAAGAGEYAFAVYDGGCGESYLDCGSGSGSDPEGDGYTEYENFAQDVGDGSHGIPGDYRTCYDSSIYNNCEDLSSDYYIHVFRTTSAFSCQHYELTVTNGSW